MNSRKPKDNVEYPVELPEPRLQVVVPDRSRKSPSLPSWKPISEIAIELPKNIRSRLH